MYASKIEFGPDAFSETTDYGLLILGVRGGVSTTCNTVCSRHGLGCWSGYRYNDAAPITCSTTSSDQRYCWCS